MGLTMSGTCVAYSSCTAGQENVEADRVNASIDNLILRDKLFARFVVKLLMLGPGEAGKSTITKQIRILHTNGFSEDELRIYSRIVQNTVVALCSSTVRVMTNEGHRFSDLNLNIFEQQLTKQEFFKKALWKTVEDSLPPNTDRVEDLLQIADLTSRIYEDAGFQQFLDVHSRKFDDGNYFFFQHLRRVLDPNFLATRDDVLRLRVQTTGITELSFAFGQYTFRVIDVGGQRTQRKKWLNLFEGISAIIFMAALSDYNQVLREDAEVEKTSDNTRLPNAVPFLPYQKSNAQVVNWTVECRLPFDGKKIWPQMGDKCHLKYLAYSYFSRETPRKNRMKDCLQLFYRTANNDWFSKTGFILFLNKTDLFTEKVQSVPLTVCFPQYTGSSNYEECYEYVKNKFLKRRKNALQSMYIHQTCATDTEKVDKILRSTFNFIMQNNAKNMGYD